MTSAGGLEAGPDTPRRAPGVDLIGRSEGSGFAQDQWLVCVDGARYVQLTARLYNVLALCDGRRSVSDIAERLGRESGTETSRDQVAWLIRERLVPAGLVVDAAAAGFGPAVADTPRVRPSGGRTRTALLAIRHRLPILPYRVTAQITSRLEPLYWPPLVITLVVAAAAANAWLYAGGRLPEGVRALAAQPELFLLLLALDIPLRVFHEFGHATAMRRAGAPCGEIGIALYVIVPVYYTDVTHAYRLSRVDRIRVDLGGIYFDLISSLVLLGLFAVTGQPVLLLAVVLTGLNILREFTPFVRFDGYYLMADLVGVADPLSLLLPLAVDLLPLKTRRRRRLPELGGTARLALLAYLLVVIAFLLRPLLILAVAGGGAAREFVRAGEVLWAAAGAAFQRGDAAGFAVSALELAFWSLVPVGLALLSASVLRLAARGATLVVTGAVRRHRRAQVEEVATPGDLAWPPAPEKEWTPDSGPSGRPQETLRGDAAGAWNGPPSDTPSETAPDLTGAAPGAAAREVTGAAVSWIYADRVSVLEREIEDLNQRLAAAHRDVDTLLGGVRILQTTLDRQVAELQGLGEECLRRA